MTMTADELNRIHARLDAILTAVQHAEHEASTRLTTLETYRISCRSEVERMSETLFGNGKPGLLTEFRQLQAVAGLKSKWFWLMATAVPAVASGAIGALFGAVAARMF
jgi:hypothetical protein